jgi:hypothetical protein
MMNDLETQLRRTLEREAGAAPHRKLPDGTRARVRRRQVISAGSAAALTAAFVAGCLVLLSVGPASRTPARTTTAAPATGMSTTPPDGWPVLGPTARPGYVHDALAFYPDNPSGGYTSEVSVLASGSVDGRSWLVTGFRTDGSGDWGGTAGPCGHLFVEPFTDPGFGICRVPQTASGRPPSVLPAAHMEGIEPGPGSGDPGGLTMYFGVVDAQVARIEVRSDGSETWDPPLISGPDGSGVRYFVLFPPPDIHGAVVALSPAGEVLAHLPLCASPGTACETPRPDSY